MGEAKSGLTFIKVVPPVMKLLILVSKGEGNKIKQKAYRAVGFVASLAADAKEKFYSAKLWMLCNIVLYYIDHVIKNNNW